MILLIDNYDSFSFNLYQMIGTLHPQIRVIRNDEMTVEEMEQLAPEKIILSPGPGRPSDEGFGRKFRSSVYASASRESARPMAQRSAMRRS